VTERDRVIASWARYAGADYVAQSFVRSADDIAEIRSVLGPQGPWLIAKIEKYEAVAALDEIVEAADAVMVARGDLGVEMPVEQVPVLQRRIVEKAQAAGKPVAVATQMLDSMIDRPVPTRAEASDVAGAIFEGADAVMLSAETAVGSYPVEAIEMMARIALAAEPEFEPPPHETVPRSRDVAGAVSAAVVTLAENLDVAAIITATRSGATAMAVAGWRPESTIVAATTEAATARRLALVWGVEPMLVAAQPNVDDTLMGAVSAACDAGFIATGDLVAITAGVAVNVSGGTDLVRVVTA
jgi:pyruvate kinase